MLTSMDDGGIRQETLASHTPSPITLGAVQSGGAEQMSAGQAGQRSAFRVTFVCTGNICRSPMAEVVFRSLAAEHRLASRVLVESAGTGDWHVGEPADTRTLATLQAAGYDGSNHRAKQFEVERFRDSDLIIYFDYSHQRVLESLAPDDTARLKLHSLVAFDPSGAGFEEVPDPYYAGEAMFHSVFELIERCCRGLFRQVAPAIQSASS